MLGQQLLNRFQLLHGMCLFAQTLQIFHLGGLEFSELGLKEADTFFILETNVVCLLFTLRLSIVCASDSKM